jgi:hypothetical protein
MARALAGTIFCMTAVALSGALLAACKAESALERATVASAVETALLGDDYAEALSLLASSEAEALDPGVKEKLLTEATRLRTFAAEFEPPKEWLGLKDGRVSIDEGIVAAIERRHKTRCNIVLENRFTDRIKPSYSVMLFNSDGILVGGKAREWVLETLDVGQRHKEEVQTQYPEELLFSKWAVTGSGDDSPAWAWVAGSPDDQQQFGEVALRFLREGPTQLPPAHALDYDLTKLLPDVLPWAPVVDTSARSQILSRVRFSGRDVTFEYLNRSGQRIQPDIAVYVFNRDGVIVQTARDTWGFLSLDPGESSEEEDTAGIGVPPTLAASRWARYANDPQPAWIYVAGSRSEVLAMQRKLSSGVAALRRQYRGLQDP